jgi:hypothetical protein
MKIIYQNQDSSVIIIFPVATSMTIDQIAQKDVPYNTPYLIVEDSDLPEDWSNSAAWEADFSSPDGIGMGAHRWFIAQAEADIVSINETAPPQTPVPRDPVVFEDIIWNEDHEEEDRPALYADYVAGLARENEQALVRYDKELASFNTGKQQALDRANALIAQMKAEVLQLEGVTL